jgi:AraC family ethanolamine operon transcriptional activator
LGRLSGLRQENWPHFDRLDSTREPPGSNMTMNYKKFASDLPLAHSLEFTSAEESEESLRSMGVEQPVRQLGSGEFRYRLAVRSTAEAELFADRFSTAVSMHLEAPAGTIAMLFPRTASGYFLASGDQVSDRKLIVMPDRSGTDISGPDFIGSEAIIIPRRRFSEMIEALWPMPQPVRLETLAIVAGNISELHTLRRNVRELVANPEQDPSRENLANLVAATIEWIGRHSRGWKPERLCSNAAPARIAKLAQEHIEAHYRNPVRLEELCRTTSVSARTLQRCFREYFDTTITEYLKTVRLDTARRELRTSRLAVTSITTVAMRHGNPHPGRFAVEYRARFGESPRETLAA